MRYRNIAITAAVTGMVAIGFAAPSHAGLTTFCDGVASDVTVPGDLVVRAGDSCVLTNVTINGNATVRADANLLLDGSTVNGNLRVNDNAFVDAIGSEVTGNARLVTAYGAYTEDSTIGGNVNATDAGFFYSVGSNHAKNVSSTNGETFLESSWVTRNLTSEGDALTDVYDTVVERDVNVSGATQGSVFCLSEVDGNASFSGNADVLQIGASAPLTGCGFNVFGGDLSVTDNTGEAFVSDNVVRGSLTCSGNDPLPVVEGNRVRGDVDCESADAAASMQSRASGLAEARKAEDRKAEVKADIDARAKAGSDDAEEAGNAFE